MKKLFSLLMTAVMLCALTACGNNGNDTPAQSAASTPTGTPDDASPTEIIDTPDTSEQNETDESSASAGTGTGNGILVAYFTYGENAPLSADVDASSSASIQLRGDGSITGNTGIVADMIADATDGELFSILTATQYPDTYDSTLDVGQAEKSDGTRPELSSHIENLENYNTIFLGFPNWWGGMPMALYSFLDEYDFSGKTIVPFVTSGGSGFSDAVNEIKNAEPEASVLEGLAIGGDQATDARDRISDWLEGLGLAG